MKLNEYLKKHRIIPDGSMGTYYSNIVNKPGAISEFANLSAPDIIEKIHKEYITAGARMLRTNTFAANRSVLKMNMDEQRLLIQAACRIAKKAVCDCKNELSDQEHIWIFGDIGPIPEDAVTAEDEILEEYKLMCDAFLEEGLEGIHFETFSNLSFIEKLVPYIKEKDPDTFILASFSVNKNGYTGSGISTARLFGKLCQIEGIDGYGLNCGIGSGHMYQILKRTVFPEHKFIYAAPNAGYPEQMQNRMVFMDNAEYFAQNMKLIAGLGADIIGGCCGTTPDYIRNLVNRIDRKERVNDRQKDNINTEDNDKAGGNIKAGSSIKSGGSIKAGSNINAGANVKAGGNVLPVRENDFYQLFHEGKKVIAVELDPPYDADIDKVMECAHKLKTIGADIITFADSPMGRSRVDSILMSIKIAEETGLNVMPHICCRDRNMISMRSVLLGAYIHGLRNLLIVTGDPVPGENRTKTTGVFDYNSVQLMDYVKEMNAEHFAKEPFYYGGALNHARGNPDKVIERMQRKIDAGAAYFLTQPIYSKIEADRLRYIKDHVNTKILCGIMPLVSYTNANFIKNELSGIYVPDEIVARYRPDMSREEAEVTGATIAGEIMEMLDPVADGYYFMLPFNRVSLMDKILRNKY